MSTTDDTNTPEDDATATATGPAPAQQDAHATEVQEPQDDRDQPPAVREARREAAGYRRRLRDTEVERDRIAGVVEGYQRTAVEQLAEQGPRALASGADLWAAGTDLMALLDEQGRPDAAKVAEAVDAALTARPHWRRSYGSADNGARGTAPEPSVAWSAVLAGGRG